MASTSFVRSFLGRLRFPILCGARVGMQFPHPVGGDWQAVLLPAPICPAVGVCRRASHLNGMFEASDTWPPLCATSWQADAIQCSSTAVFHSSLSPQPPLVFPDRSSFWLSQLPFLSRSTDKKEKKVRVCRCLNYAFASLALIGAWVGVTFRIAKFKPNNQ